MPLNHTQISGGKMRHVGLEDTSSVRHVGLEDTSSVRHVGLEDTSSVRHVGLEDTSSVRHVGLEDTSSVRHVGLEDTSSVRHVGLEDTSSVRHVGLEDTSSNERCIKLKSFCRRIWEVELDDVRSASFWRACFAEFVATLLLCFYHIGILLFMPGTEQPSLLHIAVGHGLYVSSVVTALGATSGCHMNPAVTLALATLGQVQVARSILYMASQCVGAIVGSFLLREVSHGSMAGSLGVISPGADISLKQVICTEMVITAFLLIVVVATSDGKRSDIQGSVPLTVGLTVVVNTLLANKVSGSCMNPARALGPAVVMGDYSHVWIYWLGPCSGALIGAHLYNRVLAPARSSRPRTTLHTESDDAPRPEAEEWLLENIPETDL